MSKINQYGRRFETFDPALTEHREIFHSALKYKTWGRSPIRFWSEDANTDLMYQCTQKMATWYMTQEFGKISA